MQINFNYLKTRLARNVALAASVIGALIASGFLMDLNKSEWAAWVQAVGSIAAIMGAVWIAGDQARRDSKKTEIADLQAKLGIARTIVGLSGRLFDIAVDMEDAAQRSRWNALTTSMEALISIQPALDSVLARANFDNALEYALLMHTSTGATVVNTKKAVLTKLEEDRHDCWRGFKSTREVLAVAERHFLPEMMKLERQLEKLLD